MKMLRVIGLLLIIGMLWVGFSSAEEEFRTLRVPENFGSVIDEYKGTAGKHVVLIQDLHANTSAQRNISKLILFLREKTLRDLVPVVFLEGAAGPISTSVLRTIPDHVIRDDICEYLLQEGHLSGGELAAIESTKGISLVGVEERATYLKNSELFREVKKNNASLILFLRERLDELFVLRNKLYSPQALLFERDIENYENNLSRLCPYLKGRMIEYGIDSIAFSNFENMIELIVLEDLFDFKLFLEERKLALFSLRNLLSKDEQRELISNSLSYRTGKISVKDFYDYLFALMSYKGFSFEEFSQLQRYAEIVALHDQIENSALISEYRMIISLIRKKLITDPDARMVSQLIIELQNMISFAQLTLTRWQYEKYFSGDEKIDLKEMSHQIKELCKKYNVAYADFSKIGEFQMILELCRDFYDLVKKRDAIIFQGVLNEMVSKELTHGILIVGGFHADGITALLKKAGISYSLVLPFAELNEEAEKKYTSLIVDGFSSLEQYLMLWGSMLAPRVREANDLADPSQTENLNKFAAILNSIQTMSRYRGNEAKLLMELDRIRAWARNSNVALNVRKEGNKLFLRWKNSPLLVINFADSFWSKERSTEEIARYLSEKLPFLVIPDVRKQDDLITPSFSETTQKSA